MEHSKSRQADKVKLVRGQHTFVPEPWAGVHHAVLQQRAVGLDLRQRALHGAQRMVWLVRGFKE